MKYFIALCVLAGYGMISALALQPGQAGWNTSVLSFEDAKRAADQGDAYAQAVVSLYYSLGWKTEKNLPEALKYATASAKAGNPLGIYRVGAALRSGDGTEKNEQQGQYLQKESFEGLKKMGGNPYALTSLGVMIFQGKVVQQNKPEAARLYKLAADMGYAPAQFNYAMCAKDGHGIPKNEQIFNEYVKKAATTQYPLAEEHFKKSEGVARNSIVSGLNENGERWVYEFLENSTSGKPSIIDMPSACIAFQNQDWIVMISEESGNIGKEKSDIFFYDAKTLELVTSARIPNQVISVGIVGSTFYAVTITPFSHRYDDAPLVITLIDPLTKDIDRVKLVEDDYWLALHNPILISAERNNIVVQYNPKHTNEGAYITSQPLNKHFRDIHISLKPLRNEVIAQLPLPQAASEKEFKQQAGNELACLQSVGIVPSGNHRRSYDKENKAFVGLVSNGKSNGYHLVRATPDGSLHDIYLDALKSEDYKISTSSPISPGVFDDGTLYCVAMNSLFLINNSIRTIVDIAGANVFFDKKYAYAIPAPPENIWWSRRLLGDNRLSQYFWTQISSSGQREKKTVPAICLNKETEKADSIAIYPEKKLFYTLTGDAADNIFTRFSLSTGKQNGGQIRTESGKSPTAGGINDGLAPEGWRVVCVITGFSTGGAEYSLIAKKDNEEKTLLLVSNLSEEAYPLEMRINEKGILYFLYSCAGETIYGEYVSNGKSKILAKWKSSTLDGKPLLLSAKNLVLIPKPGGYDAYRVFQGSKAEKAFEIFFRGSSDYVIILPNGYYAGSPGCEKLFTLKAGDGTVDASTLAPWKNRPAEIITALGGDPKDAALLSQVTERWMKRIGFDPSQKEPKASEILKVSVPQMPPLWAVAPTMSFPIEVTAGAEPIKEVVVRVNGVIQKRYSDTSLNVQANGSAMINASVNLAEGQNWIEVAATDSLRREGNLEHFRTILKNAQDTPKRYIIAMGCSEYERSALNLQYAVKDATDVLKTFSETGGRESKTLLLTNKDANQEAIEKIKDFTADTKESDEIILFCAGHGMLDENLDYVYAGHNFDPDHPSQTGIKLDDLIASISGGKSLKRLILMDTCHSGQVGEKEEMKLAQMDTALPSGVRAIQNRGMKAMPVAAMTGMDQQRFIEELFLLPGIHRGVNIIGASGGAEYAMESAQWNNGVFTSAIIEALRDKKADINKRGSISVSDLKNYLAKRVAELTGGAQKPSVVAFEQDQNFDLVRNLANSPK